MRKGLIAAGLATALLSGVAWAAPEPAKLASQLVTVAAYDGKDLVGRVTGVVVSADGHVVTVERLVRGADRVVVTPADSEAELVASVVGNDRGLDLALLNVRGLTGTPATAAKERGGGGLPVHVPILDGAAPRTPKLASGTVGRIVAGGSAASLMEHNALSPKIASLGAPVVNDCGELVALNRTDPTRTGLFSDPLAVGASFVHAVPAADLKQFLAANGFTLAVADAACATAVSAAEAAAKTEAEKAKAEAARADAAQAAADEAKQAADKAAAEAAEAEEKAKSLEKAAAEARRKLDEIKGTADAEAAARAAAEEALRQAEEAAASARAAADTALADANAARQKLEAALAELEARNRAYGWIIAGMAAGGVLLGLLALFLARRQKRRAAAAEVLAREAQGRAEELAQCLDQQQRLTAPDIVIEGQTPEGQRVGIKAPGDALIRARSGLVLGRSLQGADIVLDHVSVSRAHLRLTAEDMGGGVDIRIEDMNSTNGTAVNGRPLTPGRPSPLRNGDRLTIGAVEARVQVLS